MALVDQMGTLEVRPRQKGIWINEYSPCKCSRLLGAGVGRVLAGRILTGRVLPWRILSTGVLARWVRRSGVLARGVLPRWVLSRGVGPVSARSWIGVVATVRGHSVGHVVGRLVSSHCGDFLLDSI